MVSVSEAAKKQLDHLVGEDSKTLDAVYVRVGVKSGGCSGLSYHLDIVDSINDDDKLIEDKGVRLIVDKKSVLYLAGTTLEYSGGLNGRGFVFNNPNASRTCGCGESFAV